MGLKPDVGADCILGRGFCHITLKHAFRAALHCVSPKKNHFSAAHLLGQQIIPSKRFSEV